MPILYRVFPSLPDADDGEPGHALFVPGLSGGRIDNPEHYLALYLSDGPGGACSEAFAYKQVWDAGMLRGPPGLPGSSQALAQYMLDEHVAVCDLDDSERLVELGLRPSQVVTRDRDVTRAWALRIFNEDRWGGVRWWSYYDPRWGSHGIWAINEMEIMEVHELDLGDPAILEAAEVLNRPVA